MWWTAAYSYTHSSRKALGFITFVKSFFHKYFLHGPKILIRTDGSLLFGVVAPRSLPCIQFHQNEDSPCKARDSNLHFTGFGFTVRCLLARGGFWGFSRVLGNNQSLSLSNTLMSAEVVDVCDRSGFFRGLTSIAWSI